MLSGVCFAGAGVLCLCGYASMLVVGVVCGAIGWVGDVA